MLTFQIPTREDTRTFGRALGALLRPGDVIALIGDLGAGKTTMTQAIAEGMGITDAVTSPTFTLVQEYGDVFPLFHFDPYRLECPEDMCDFGFSEYFEQGGVVVVEWADRVISLLPQDHLALILLEHPAPSVAETSAESGDGDPTKASEVERGETGENEEGETAFPENQVRFLRLDAGDTRSRELLEALSKVPALQALRITPEKMPPRPVGSRASAHSASGSERGRRDATSARNEGI